MTIESTQRHNGMILQAIVTKYISPTNTRAGRVKATAAAGSVTLEWEHALNTEANHAAAAKALADKYEWTGRWYGGGMPDAAGYVFVCEARESGPVFTTANP